MMHSIAHKHLWPRCLQSSPGISWGWLRKEKLILLLSAPPLTSFLHSSSNSLLLLFLLLLYCHDFINPPPLFERISKCTFSFSARTKRRQTLCYSLLLTVPFPLALLILCLSHSLAALSNTITKYQALPSPISRMLGELRRSAGPRNRDTQSVVVGATVCQSHLHSTVFQPASFKWSGKGELLSMSGVRWNVGGGKHEKHKRWWCTEKARRRESCALTWVTQGMNVWWERAETVIRVMSIPVVLHVLSHQPQNLYIYLLVFRLISYRQGSCGFPFISVKQQGETSNLSEIHLSGHLAAFLIFFLW